MSLAHLRYAASRCVPGHEHYLTSEMLDVVESGLFDRGWVSCYAANDSIRGPARQKAINEAFGI